VIIHFSLAELRTLKIQKSHLMPEIRHFYYLSTKNLLFSYIAAINLSIKINP